VFSFRSLNLVGLIGFIFSALHILNIGILCGKDGILDERKILLFLQTTFCLGTYATTFSDGPGMVIYTKILLYFH